jgi:hypothetical protein
MIFSSLDFKYNKWFIGVLIFVLAACNEDTSKPRIVLPVSEGKKIFKKLDSHYTGLNFANNLTPNVSGNENLFNYDYFYNGAGVGIADINNDDLPDIFFCGNQVENKLYLNKGNLTFEDISKKALINENKNWSNGVSFVDINNDGWVDIYVSQGGPNSREKRKNLLYLNQKNETFKEVASEYGLADAGISTQTVFFDIDNDNDLDCLVMNENEFFGVDPFNLYKLVANNDTTKYYNSSHLYRNDHGKFVDITKQSGIEQPIFGLGVSVSDFNNDGWLDFYMASDYYIPDVLFINNQDRTFTDQIKNYTKHISFYGMGMDIADINNDLKEDIFVLDMASSDHIRAKTLMASMNTQRFDYLINKANFHHQYMYNSLQLQTKNQKYSNISQATNMAQTDWSWSVLLSDYDLDGDKDVYITNGYRKYALDNDLQRRVYEAKVKYKGKVPLEVKKALYEGMPSEKLPNTLFENNGGLQFKERGKDWGLADYSFSNGAAQGDLDNDGDLDLVVNNIDETCFLYQNMSREKNLGNFLKIKTNARLSEAFPKITLKYNGKKLFMESRRIRGYRSSNETVAHFGIGKDDKIDTVTVEWPSGTIQEKYNILANSTIQFSEVENQDKVNKKNDTLPSIFSSLENSELGITYSHKENVHDDFETEILLPYKQSSLGPFISKGDINGDGRDDFFIGGASGQEGEVYLQNANGKFTKKVQKAFSNDKLYEDMESVLFDWDGDGDNDLFVVSGGNEFPQYSSLYADRLYINNGLGEFVRYEIPALKNMPKSGKTVTAIDIDKDGDKDLIVGNRIIPQNYPLNSKSIIYENKNQDLIDVTSKVAPSFENYGIINSVIATDFDNDGWQDFIAVGEWTRIGIFRNEKGTFSNIGENSKKIKDLKGWWFSVSETDINKDGLPDYLVGNIGANIKFNASPEKPFKIFANDFDENGTTDIVLSKQYKGDYVPVRGRECSSQQMPFIQRKFKTYSEFANANLNEIYGDKLFSGFEAEANEFMSIAMINLGNGNFDYAHLPFEAQLFPILESVFIDLNNDGFEDVIVGGNIYETEVETPRLDSFSGLVLISDGENNYSPLDWTSSGLLFDGNIKDIKIIEREKDLLIMGTQNDGAISTFKIN